MVEGTVTNVAPSCAYVGLGGGVEALLHIDDVSNEPVNHLASVLAPGTRVKVRQKVWLSSLATR